MTIPLLRSPWLARLATGAVFAAAVLLHLADRPPPAPIFTSLADEVLLYPLALRAAEPDLYPRDPWVHDAERIFSRLYSVLLAPLLVRARDPLVLAWWLSALPRALVLAGTFVLVRRAARSALAAALAAGALLLPGAAAWSVAPTQALPRDFVFSLLPWLLLLLPAEPSRRPRRLAILGFLLGLAANLHPLTALHLLLLLAPAAALLAGRRAAPALLACGIAFALGALPYALAFIDAPRDGLGSPEALLARVPDLVSLSPPITLAAWGPVVLLLAPVLLCRFPGLADPRPLLTLLGVAAVLAVPLAMLTATVPALTQLQFMRCERLLGFLAVLPAAALAAYGLEHPRPRAIAAAIAVVLILATIGVQRPLLARAAKRVFGRTPPAAPPAPSRPRGGDPARRGPEDRRAYLALCAFVRDNTPRGALFLVPPEDFSHFRLYARRALCVDRKSGGFAVSLLGRRGLEWLSEYRAAVAAYASRDPAALLTFARARGVDYVLAERPGDEFPLPVVFSAGPFVLHSVPAAGR